MGRAPQVPVLLLQYSSLQQSKQTFTSPITPPTSIPCPLGQTRTRGGHEILHSLTGTMMEASSPLAAMQPPPYIGHCGYNNADLPPSYVSWASVKKFGTGSFNFKDLSMHQSMKKSNSDYFNMKPVRGSSPTASLAADLSQNFHIDQRYGFVWQTD